MANSIKETDYLIIGAGAMGIAFADELFTLRPNLKITIIDRRANAGGHWNNAYPFVKLHQPAAFYGVNSLKLGKGGTDLSSLPEILAYYEKVIDKFKASDRVEFLGEHNYLGNGKVADLRHPDNITTYKIRERIVDATYMKVEVPSTHTPKYKIAEGVTLMPLNELPKQYQQWEKFCVIGSGKTGIDAVLFLLAHGVSADAIHWIVPNDAWMFNRSHIQIGLATKELLEHADYLKNGKEAQDIFLSMEKTGGIMRLDKAILPKKWRCATVSPEELTQLKRIKNIIRKGRVDRITDKEIQLQQGTIAYQANTLFVDCSANALSKQAPSPIFSAGKITLQSILFCQQVFSAAAIAKLALTNSSDEKRNEILPVPHPDLATDWPTTLVTSLENLVRIHRRFPLWMFGARLNLMSHESPLAYLRYAIKTTFLIPGIKKAAARMDDAG